MYSIDNMPHLKAYIPDVSFPKSRMEATRFSMVFLLSPTLKDSQLTIGNTPIINKGIARYYIDRQYHGKLFGRTYHENLLSLQIDNVSSKEGQQIRPERIFRSLRNSNVFVDLHKYNDIYFNMITSGTMYDKRAVHYIDFIKDSMTRPEYNPYQFKTMVVDMDRWAKYFNDANSVIDIRNNPLSYIMYLMRRNVTKFKELGDVNIVFTTGKLKLMVNPSKCDKTSYSRFQTESRRLMASIPEASNFDMDRIGSDSDDNEQTVRNEVIARFNNDTGFRRLVGEESKDMSEIDRTMDTITSNAIDIIEEENEDLNMENDSEKIEDMIEDVIPSDVDVEKIAKLVTKLRVGDNPGSSKRDELLRERQREIKLHGKTLGELTEILSENIVQHDLETNDVSAKVSTTNENVKKVTFNQFEKVYNEKMMAADTAKVISSLNNASIPVYIRKIDVVDTSNELSLKETYTVSLEDANRVRHTLKFDMPLFIDDKFMYLNGNKKLIVKQLLLKPIVKVGPNTVQVVSNYNKIFVRRHGANVSSRITKMIKALEKESKSVSVKRGRQTTANKKYVTTIEFDEYARRYETIRSGDCVFMFNIGNMYEFIEKNPTFPKIVGDNLLPIGYHRKDKKFIYVDTSTQNVVGLNVADEDITTHILMNSGDDFSEQYAEQTAGKKYMYTRATIMSKDVSMLLLLGYVEGLSSLLRKANIKHSFSDTRPKVGDDQGVVQFEDGYLIYDKYPFENSLLLNAFTEIPTRSYKYEDFDNKETYIDLFDLLYNQRNLSAGFDNFYDFMIDPITKEVLESLDLPTEFVDVMLYAHKLLMDNDYTPETDMSLYRIRSNELVNVYLYKAIAAAYRQYYNTSNNNNPTKISIPQDYVTKQVLTAQTIEDYSILNPIVELEKVRTISPKGPAGANLSQAFTLEKRSYSKSMVGTMAMSTSPDGNVGVVRTLTSEPSITSPRGFFDVKSDNLDELRDVNLFSPAELLSPMGASRDDTIRTAMSIKQSKHIIPVNRSSPVLISNGIEQVVPYNLTTDFSIVAKYNGKVVEIDTENELVIIEYPSAKNPKERYQAIDVSKRVVKNGGGGFYLVNQLYCDFKVGDKFEKNDIIAYDSAFFSDDTDGVRFNIGSLQNIAIMSSYSTYEDSTLITKKLARDVASKITIPKEITLGKNANVDYIVKVGDDVKVGDELIRFDTSFQDESLNKFLANVGEDLKEDIATLGKHPILSKYSGKIVDIKVYSTVDTEELSPSLQKIVNKSYGKTKKRKNALNKYDKSDSLYKMNLHITDPTTKIETKDGKIKGNIVGEGVLIQIFIEYLDVAGIGDKITFFTALKSIVGEMIPEGYEPYAISNPDEEISSFVAPGAVLARMTPSLILTMFGNKVLVNLKRELEKIYNS